MPTGGRRAMADSDVPPLVSSIQYVYSTPTEMVVAWDSEEPAGAYHVQYSPRYLGRWQDWDDAYTVPCAVITELQPGNRYSVRVRAQALGSGAWGPWTVADTDLYTTQPDGNLPASATDLHKLQLDLYTNRMDQLAQVIEDET
ncbi:fibronectin type III domain-containing protein, partial [archaeon]